jgi:hypothetical protein
MNVANKLGIDIDTPISTVLTTAASTIGFGFMLLFAALWYFNKEKR